MKKVPPGATKWATTRAQPDVGQPAEHAARRVDDVELALERVDGRSYRLDSTKRASGKPSSIGQGPRQLDRGRRDVRAGHPGAQPGPGQRVDPEVALQVEERLAGDVADHLDLVRPEPDAAGLERLEVVEIARRVDPRPGVPEGPIGLERGARGPLGPSVNGATRRRARPAPCRPPGRKRRGGPRGRGSTASPRGGARRSRPRRARSSGRRSRRGRARRASRPP